MAQIAQQVSHLSRPQGHLPSQLETNPKGQMNSITLRSGNQLEEQKGPQVEEDEGLVRDQGQEIVEEKENSSPKSRKQGKNEKAIKPKPVEPYRRLISFP